MARSNTRKAALALTAPVLVLLLAWTMRLDAQAPAADGAAPAHAARPHKRPSAAHPEPPPQEEQQAPVTPPAPEAPHWPMNEQPAQAAVVWDSHGLRIDATNSSLQQILKDFSTETGAKVEGLGTDQRVYGAYGPGQARDVLSQLLQGSGYNVIMIGDQGQGAPRQILLSARNATDAQNAANKGGTNNNGDDEAVESSEPEEQPQQPVYQPPMRPGFGPGGPPRTPQQIMQEMQQRQQQMQQRNGTPNNPQNPQ